jgi:hypothetical protein
VVLAAQADLLADVSAFAPPLLEPAAALVAGISTRNWALEWGLSSWIAQAYGLTPAEEHALRVSDVLLLAVARAVDDLADGESGAALPGSVVLATALHHLWTRRYLLTFSAAQLRRFLPHLDRHTASWLLATLPEPADGMPRGREPGAVATAAAPGPPDPAGLGRHADRGAFLRISCAAGCVLAGREDATDALVAAIDDVLVGVVLLDDVFDWRQDLEAGRRNAFVEECLRVSDAPVPPRLRVVHAMHTGDTLERYFGTAAAHLRRAAATASGAGCHGLAGYAAWYEEELGACAHWLREGADRAVATAAASLRDTDRTHDLRTAGGGEASRDAPTGG